MVTAVSCAQVPKFTVIIGGSYGAGNYGMCGRAFNPRFLWMWPNARICVMGPEQAASVLATVKRDALEKIGQVVDVPRRRRRSRQPVRDKLTAEAHPYFASARAVGRRRDRSRRHAPRARACDLRVAQRAGRAHEVRRVPDVDRRFAHDLRDTRAHAAARPGRRASSREEVEPHGDAWEEAGVTPRAVLRKMGALGMLGPDGGTERMAAPAPMRSPTSCSPRRCRSRRSAASSSRCWCTRTWPRRTSRMLARADSRRG